jgi:membrane-associated protease RseP (regulator of RpoE activity)
VEPAPNKEDGQKQDSDQRRVEFKFPLLILRTNKFAVVFDRIGALRFSRYASWVALAIVPLVAAFGLFLIVGNLIAVLSNPAVGQVARDLGPGAILLLPGINPFLPIVYGWIAIVIAIAIHEGAHGVVARNAGLRVKSSGLLFFLIIPIGAFVDVDEDEIKKAKPRASLRIMAAGVGGNIVVALVCVLGVILIVSSLTPIINGLYISQIENGLPAQKAGLTAGDVFVSINNQSINNVNDLQNFLGNKTPGDVVYVTVVRGDMYKQRYSAYVNLTESGNRTVMGILVGDLNTATVLSNYETVTPTTLFLYLLPPLLAPTVVPFSDSLAPFYTSWIGPQWQIWANTLFWIWFVNFNVAIFNALPIYPLDGGRMFNISLKGLGHGKLSEKTITTTTTIVSAVCITIVLLVTIYPFIA